MPIYAKRSKNYSLSSKSHSVDKTYYIITKKEEEKINAYFRWRNMRPGVFNIDPLKSRKMLSRILVSLE